VCIGETLSRVRIPSSPQILAMQNSNDKFYVYILQSMKDFFYIGQCDDLDRRMSKHFDGMSKYTSSKRPLRLVYFEVFTSRIDAIKREREIKSKKSKKYTEYLILNWSVARLVEGDPKAFGRKSV
jgi:putative endonuclease